MKNNTPMTPGIVDLEPLAFSALRAIGLDEEARKKVVDYANGFATHLTDEDIAKNVAAACAASGDPKETYWMLFQYVAEQNLDEIFEMLVKHFEPEFREEFRKDFYTDFEVVPNGPETFIRCNGIVQEIRKWTELSAATLAWTTRWISRRSEPLEELTGVKPKS